MSTVIEKIFKFLNHVDILKRLVELLKKEGKEYLVGINPTVVHLHEEAGSQNFWFLS